MGTPREGAAAEGRLHFLDNLRTAMIFLVVLYHSGVVYESSGLLGSFWIVDDPATNDLAGLLNVVIDLFAMPAIFFVSGFLAPLSIARTSGRSFLARRFRRLMVPWVLAVLLLIPMYKVLFLLARDLPQEHWSTYFHFTNGVFSQSWLWFLPVLFAFDALFLLMEKVGMRPRRLPLGPVIGVAVGVGVAYSYALSVMGLTGWTKSILFDFQNERLLVYFLVFLIGALCYDRGVFASAPGRKRGFIVASALAWIPVDVYVLVLLNLLFRPDRPIVSLPVDLLVLWSACYISMAVLLYILVSTFRFWIDGHGRVARMLGEAAYGVYVVHMIVLGALALLLLHTDIPSLGKYATLTVGTWVGSNLLVHAYRKVVRGRALLPLPARAS